MIEDCNNKCGKRRKTLNITFIAACSEMLQETLWMDELSYQMELKESRTCQVTETKQTAVKKSFSFLLKKTEILTAFHNLK